MAALRRISSSPQLALLAGIVVLGAALRFATLDLQSYRYDEAVTVGRVLHPSLFATLAEVPRSESTPPLYYLLAWLWSRPFGTGEVWMRSLSALAGTGAILAVYLGARALPLPRRGALVAAAAVAVSPVLIWFSQDARAYSLVFLLSALGFLFFARARRSGSRRDLALWALFSALAIWTHYFAGFVVAPEAALLLAGRERRRAAAAVLAVLLAALALAPIALRQADHGHAGWIAAQPLGPRLERVAAKLVGSDNGDEHGVRQGGPIPLGVPLALGLAALALLLWRGDPEERRGAALAAIVGGTAVALPLALGLVGGADYLDGRNLIPAFVPLTIVLGAGFGVRRAARLGAGLAAAFCLCALVFSLEIDRLPRLQREDLRAAAAAVGPLGPGKAVVTGRYTASQPLRYYLGAEPARRALWLREIDLVGSAAAASGAGRLLPPAFRRDGSRPVSYEFTLTRFRAPHPVRVPLRRLEDGSLVGGGRHAVALVAPPAPAPASAGSGPGR